MRPFLYNFFHNETNDRTEKGTVNIPTDPSDWPEEWRTIEYKDYALFPHIPLPQTNGRFFKDLLQKRRSSAGFILNNKPSLASLASILQCGYGLQGDPTAGAERGENRTVPSAGKRYPLEIYLFLFKPIDGCDSGIFHYGVKGHSLEPFTFRAFSPGDISAFTPTEWLQNTTGMLVITSVFHRTIRKYGSRGYRYVLIEAGHVAQNMLLAGTEQGINMIPIGGLNEQEIEKMVGWSPSERVVYGLFF